MLLCFGLTFSYKIAKIALIEDNFNYNQCPLPLVLHHGWLSSC